jgi:TPR repeat protein
MKEALTAFNEGRYVKAIEIAKPLAEKENGDALFLMGFAYESGRGVELSREKAIEFYTKAGSNQQKDATYRLAQMYLSSKEQAERDKALNLLEESAKKDPATAGRFIGEGYLKGLFTGKQDIEQAIKWWNTASEAGDIASTTALAQIYDGPEPFKDKKDPKKSIALYKKAIDLGDKGSMVALGSRLLNGDASIRDEKAGREILDKAITEKIADAYLALGDFEENVQKNIKNALLNYEKGADQKQIDCALRASDIYLEGREGVAKNETKAMEFLAKAAATGHPLGNYRYAAKLLQAPDPDNRKDEEKIATNFKAYPYILNAAKGNVTDAQNIIALFYLQGLMGVSDPAAAAGWFQLSAQSGNPVAMANLASLYEKGYGVSQNLGQAGKLYEAAARGGSSAAAAAVARLMASGMGTSRNIPQAWAWANFAIQEGSQDAKALLGEIATVATSKDIEEGTKFLEELRAEVAKARGTQSTQPEKKEQTSPEPDPTKKTEKP